MKKRLFILLLVFSCQNMVWSQQDLNRFTNGLVLGYLDDTLFETENEQTLILLNQNTNELNLTLFKEGVVFENKELQNFFDEVIGDLVIQFTIDPASFEHKENAIESDIFHTVALAKINGISSEVYCSYSVHRLKTNSQIYNNMKLTLSVVINRSDFDLITEMSLSEEIELEITEGIINIQ